MPRFRPRFLFLTLLVFSAIAAQASPASADDANIEINRAEIAEMRRGERPLDVGAIDILALPAEQLEKLSPLMRDIRAALLSEQEQLSTLNERLSQATNADAALALQREIEAVKQSAEIQVLEIQLSHARIAGNAELTKQLEIGLRALRNPPRFEQPAVREQ